MPDDQRLPIILDIQATLSPDNAGRGIGRYVVDLTEALLAQTDRVVLLGLNPLMPPPRNLAWDLYASGKIGFITKETVEKVAPNGAWYCILSPVELTPPASSVIPSWLADSKYKLATVAYDLIPMLYPDIFLRNEVLKERYMSRMMAFQSSDVVLAISQSTANDMTTHLDIPKERVHNIFTGVSPAFFHRTSSAEVEIRRELPQITKPFVFTVSGFAPHKNLNALLDGLSLLPQEIRKSFQLVVSCTLLASEKAEWEEEGRRRGLDAEDVVFTGWIADTTLRALYQAAELFVFPSLYEGFGLPPAEAIVSGTATIASNTSSLPEIVGDANATFDPKDPESIKNKLLEFLSDEAARKQLCASQQSRLDIFSWKSVANNFMQAIETHERGAARSALTPRLQRWLIATPMPPAGSGIATYNSRLVTELQKYVAVDVAVETQDELDYCEANNISAVHRQDIGTHVNPYSYDQCIWVIGNSDFHIEIRRLAESFPGVVWMHDTCLAFLDVWLAYQSLDFYGAMKQSLDRSYGARFSDLALARLNQLNPYEFAQRGMSFTGPLFRHASRVITSSDFARQLVTLDQGPDAKLPPIKVIPHAFQMPDESTTSEREHRPGARLVIGTIGIGAPVKLPALVIRSASRATFPVEVRFIGHYDKELAAKLIELAEQLDIDFKIIDTPDDAEYMNEIRQLDVAVQLRESTNGESSGALSDAISAGVPVITNMPTVSFTSPAVINVAQQPSETELAALFEQLAKDQTFAAFLRESALKLAASWTFADVARALCIELGVTT